jgi:hypothetical protein
VPAASALVTSVAWPLVRAPVPIAVLPSRNVTDPLGVPPDDVTVAVNVTALPAVAGFGAAANAVAVAAGFTVSVTGLLVLAPNAELPP